MKKKKITTQYAENLSNVNNEYDKYNDLIKHFVCLYVAPLHWKCIRKKNVKTKCAINEYIKWNIMLKFEMAKTKD